MNIKKLFCCVPIINVRQNLTLTHDKAVQYNHVDIVYPPNEVRPNEVRLTSYKDECYRNAGFVEGEQHSKRVSLDSCNGSSPGCRGPEGDNTGLELKERHPLQEGGKPKEVSYHEILINHLTDSISSINTLNSNYSTPLPKVCIFNSGVISIHKIYIM